MEDYRKNFIKAGQQLGLGETHPYQLRHGGATEDLTSGRRDHNAVKSRGRWKTDGSVRRYAKSGKVQQLLGKMSRIQLNYCHWAEKNMAKVVLGLVQPRSCTWMAGLTCFHLMCGHAILHLRFLQVQLVFRKLWLMPTSLFIPSTFPCFRLTMFWILMWLTTLVTLFAALVSLWSGWACHALPFHARENMMGWVPVRCVVQTIFGVFLVCVSMIDTSWLRAMNFLASPCILFGFAWHTASLLFWKILFLVWLGQCLH